MSRLREADLSVGDRLRYQIGKGVSATHIPGEIVGIDRGTKPTMALFAREDTGGQLMIRLGHLARHSTRLSDRPVSARSVSQPGSLP